ncbi:MAG TPA: class I SAM-dependent methyltransferase [Stellaceae bacterium]|nr:class I SAM-dependent methyltransferase [Stellaceae bacterium]
MNGFSADWLALRERADGAARDKRLARRFAATLPVDPRILDLGAGTGANIRALAPMIGGAHWILVERDPALRRDAMHASFVTLDLADSWPALGALAADAVTASAFFDLASEAWLERFAAWLAARRLPLLAALTVDGRREWRPADPDDALVAAAFRAHQRRDKGLGPAVGPDAVGALARLLAAHGFEVAAAASDWRLGENDRFLLEALIVGEAKAARAAAPEAAAMIAAWERRRLQTAASGRLGAVIGHRDVLALAPQI